MTMREGNDSGADADRDACERIPDELVAPRVDLGRATKPEIMAPAGDWTCLRAALAAGADAVYFGVGQLNMRAKAGNFELDALPEVSKACHEKGAKAYLTLNTLVYERERDAVSTMVEAAMAAKVDAVIAWDFAVVAACRRAGMPVFASTQMSISNSESLLTLYRQFGIRRFVLARECTLEAMRGIRRALIDELGNEADAVGLEVFAHGSLCISVSGRCLLSEYQFGKSGGRGECIQPCRRLYRISDVEEGHDFVLGEDYVLSPKDLCTLPFIDELLEAGAASLKIEGRNRNAEYVDVVTRAYRRIVDAWYAIRRDPDRVDKLATLKEELLASVAGVYNRGQSGGFYMGRTDEAWRSREINQSRFVKRYIGRVTNYYRKVGAAEVDVRQHQIALGETVMIRGNKTGVLWQNVVSLQVDRQPVTGLEGPVMMAMAVDREVRPGDEVFRLDLREQPGV